MTPDDGPDGPPAPAGRDDDEPVLPTVTRDELDEGWGDDRGSGERDADWYRRERPPHHGS